MAQLNAYLNFNGNCREAMTFYKECFGGELEIQTIGESPVASQMPREAKDNVMHSRLEAGGIVFMAADMMEGAPVPGNTLSLAITGTSKEEIEKYFSKLSAGGKVGHPISEEFFGWYGELTDKFGIHWLFQADKAKTTTVGHMK